MEACKGERSVTKIAEEYGVNPTQVHRWKKELVEHGSDIFVGRREEDREAFQTERDELYRKVGHQRVQINFLKKTGSRSIAQLRQMIESNHRQLLVREQSHSLNVITVADT